MDLSDEASQAAAGGREEGCADSSSVAPFIYTHLYHPTALCTSLVVTDNLLVFYGYSTYMPLTILINTAVKFED